MPEMSGTTAPDDASFTLPSRPGVGLVEHPRVDLLAGEPARRHLPDGSVAGCAVLGALVLLSCLVGGPTAGFVVVGVTTLLTTCAALVTGHLSLGQVDVQRSASLLLGVGAAALILGSVVSEHDRPAPGVAAGTPVPVSAGSTAQAPSAHAAPSTMPSRSAQATVASASPTGSTEPVADAGLTLSPDALAPRPTEGVEGGTGKAGPAVAVTPKTPQASNAKPSKPAQAATAATAKPGKSTPVKSKPVKSKPAISKPPVAVRHGFAIVASTVRDLL